MMSDSPDPAPSKLDEIFHFKIWSFTREYPNIPPNTLFDAMTKSLRDTPFFKVWKADSDSRYIELTTYSVRLDPDVNYHQVQADVKVLEGKDQSSSVVNIRITPTLIGVISLYEMFTNVDVNDKFAKYAANLIFGAIEEGYRKF